MAFLRVTWGILIARQDYQKNFYGHLHGWYSHPWVLSSTGAFICTGGYFTVHGSGLEPNLDEGCFFPKSTGYLSWLLPILALYTILYSTYHTLQYCKGLQTWGSEPNILFQLWNVCSYWEVCLLWSNGLSLKHIQCFVLMSRDCLSTLWRQC